MNIYVGNLPYEATDELLEVAFTDYGEVASARVITDRYSGQSRGFGFVEMPNDTEAQAAIAAMNGKDFKGRALTVNEARPREDRGGGGRRRPRLVADGGQPPSQLRPIHSARPLPALCGTPRRMTRRNAVCEFAWRQVAPALHQRELADPPPSPLADPLLGALTERSRPAAQLGGPRFPDGAEWSAGGGLTSGSPNPTMALTGRRPCSERGWHRRVR